MISQWASVFDSVLAQPPLTQPINIGLRALYVPNRSFSNTLNNDAVSVVSAVLDVVITWDFPAQHPAQPLDDAVSDDDKRGN